MSASPSNPTVTEVVFFEDLPLGARGSRRALVRWSDGSESEALRWYADEILICEGDHGNCAAYVRSLVEKSSQRASSAAEVGYII